MTRYSGSTFGIAILSLLYQIARMIHDTLNNIERRLQESTNLQPENRSALEEMLAQLRSEIEEMREDESEQADSITGFAEALRDKQDKELLALNLSGLEKSVRDFEVSHPQLTSVVNSICKALSDIGI